jgi:hypothetical protein
LIKPGGLVIVESPNYLGIVEQAFRYSEQDPGHLYVFSPQTLSMYFNQVDLRITKKVTLTRTPYDIYSQLGRFALEFTKEANAKQKENIAALWSPKNNQRMREFQKTAKFFDSIGRGSAVAVVGTKD